jgi:hypothetical protein
MSRYSELEEENAALREELRQSRMLIAAILRTIGGRVAIPRAVRERVAGHDTIETWLDPESNNKILVYHERGMHTE